MNVYRVLITSERKSEYLVRAESMEDVHAASVQSILRMGDEQMDDTYEPEVAWVDLEAVDVPDPDDEESEEEKYPYAGVISY